MKWINRIYEERTDKILRPNKVTIIYGPRRCGKTSLVKKMLQEINLKIFQATGEDFDIKNILESKKLSLFKSVFGDFDILFIDEAQYIQDIGLSLKLIVDNFDKISIVVTGSSSFDIANKLYEPLTGRQIIKKLYPISCIELKKQYGGIEIIKNLEMLLVFGMYPEVLVTDNLEEKQEYLINLRNSYLFKDILAFENVKNSQKLFDLLRLIAYQIGKEVSLSELATSLGIAKKTVERYLDLLEKSFVIKKITGFSRNLRSEVTKTARYYFYDNGILNSIINNFNMLNLRNDIGTLWENFIVSEFLKKQEYYNIYANNYFWRTYQRQEIDFVEERDGLLYAYEIKWKPRKVKPPKLWLNTYKNSEFNVVTGDNFLEFIV